MLGFKWIVLNELAGSPQPGLYGDWEDDIEYLKKRKITFVMSLTESPLIEEALKNEEFLFFHFPIRDMDIPMPRNAFQAVLFMREKIQEGHKFLIHCKGGVGRTGMIGACYLVSKGIPAEEAIKQVRSVHQPYIQTRNQELFVVHFEEFLKNEKNKID